MKIAEIIEKIEQFAPLNLQENYDNAGLQVGDTEQVATGALITLDITESVVDEAIYRHCNLVISHHPLLFHGIKRISNGTWIERIITKAIKNDIVLYSAHTNLDKCEGGVNYEMARLLGLGNVKVLMPEQDDRRAGLGCIGQLPTPENYVDCLRRIKRIFDVKVIRHTTLLDRPVRTIALCSGSGSEFIHDAISQGADLYITGDVTYHKFFDADNQIVIADIGHFESEHIIKDLFVGYLSNIFPKFAVWKSDKDCNVVNYL